MTNPDSESQDVNRTDPPISLTDFLQARILDDENWARMAGHGCGYLHEHNAGWVEVEFPDEHNARPSYELGFIRRNSPDRVLADCRAKRKILERCRASNGYWGAEIERLIATCYQDHPEWREEWRQ